MTDAQHKRTPFEARIAAALKAAPPQWTSACLEPGDLFNLIEQGETAPTSVALLAHVETCSFCQQQYVQMRKDLWKVSEEVPAPMDPASVLAKRMRELLEGIVTPVRSLREAMNRVGQTGISNLTLSSRSAQTPLPLMPVSTVVRSTTPTLQWQAAARAKSYEVILVHLQDQQNRIVLWTGNTGSQTSVRLPDPVTLERGEIYLWQVAGGPSHPSPSAWFQVLTAEDLKQVEAAERQYATSALALASVYTEYGLYEEALEQAQQLVALNPDSSQAHRLLQGLLRQLGRDETR